MEKSKQDKDQKQDKSLAEEKTGQSQNKHERDMKLNEEDRDLARVKRPMSGAANAKDLDEIEKNTGKGRTDKQPYAGASGDPNKEPSDYGDLPDAKKNDPNYYRSKSSEEGTPQARRPVDSREVHVVKNTKPGFAAGKADSYVDAKGNKKVAPEKREKEKSEK